MRSSYCLYVCVSIQVFNQPTDFDVTWYELCSTGARPIGWRGINAIDLY
jgi:hypothetical protein